MFANCSEYTYPTGKFVGPVDPGPADVYKSYKNKVVEENHPVFSNNATISGPIRSNPGSDRILCEVNFQNEV
jgi:hypothetical protein